MPRLLRRSSRAKRATAAALSESAASTAESSHLFARDIQRRLDRDRRAGGASTRERGKRTPFSFPRRRMQLTHLSGPAPRRRRPVVHGVVTLTARGLSFPYVHPARVSPPTFSHSFYFSTHPPVVACACQCACMCTFFISTDLFHASCPV